MAKYLDSSGVTYLWQKIKGAFATKSEVQSVESQLANYVPNSAKGVANGIATLDAEGKVPSSQLPSYVDDVVEVASFSDLPATGEVGKIYVTLDDNKTYRWGGTTYVEIAAGLALGETTGTAYEGSKGKALADRMDALPSSFVTGVKGDSESTYRTGQVSITKANVGLGNVTNNAQVKGLASGTTNGHVVTWGSDGYTVADSGFTLGKSVPSDAVFTDESVTAVGNHYTPSSSNNTTKSASGGTATDVCGNNTVQVVTGVKIDAAGHVTGVTSVGVKGSAAVNATADSALSTSEIDSAIAAA